MLSGGEVYVNWEDYGQELERLERDGTDYRHDLTKLIHHTLAGNAVEQCFPPAFVLSWADLRGEISLWHRAAYPRQGLS